jgi:hypothetical protein
MKYVEDPQTEPSSYTRVTDGQQLGLLRFFLNLLWSNVTAAARLEGIKIVGAACFAIDAGYCSQLDSVDPPCVVVDPGQAGLLNAIDPEGAVTIVSSRRCSRSPVQLNGMCCITDREPDAGGPVDAVVDQGSPELVATGVVAELNPQHHGGRARVAVEDVMSIATGHRDRVGVEVEAGPVSRLSAWPFVCDVNAGVVIDDGLHAVATNQGGGCACTEITTAGPAGRPGR